MGEAEAILRHASESGISSLDTAVAYGDSEEVLGRIGVRGWRITSKLPAVPRGLDDVAAWVERQVAGSLARLRVDRLDALLLHHPRQLIEDRGDRLYASLTAMQSSGMAGTVGISVYDPEELEAIVYRYPCGVVQIPLNVTDRRFVESGWVERLSVEGTTVQARSVFLQGLLLMRREDRPASFHRWAGIWSAWDSWVREQSMSPLEACLRFALSTDGVDQAVVGVDSLVQLKEVLASYSEAPVEPPRSVQSGDSDLINPSRWKRA